MLAAVALPPTDPDACAHQRRPLHHALPLASAAPSNARVIAGLHSFRLALALTGGDLAAVPRLMKPAEHDRPRVSDPATVRQAASVVTRNPTENTR